MDERITVAAVDLGASSGRVLHAAVSAEHASVREVHRFANVPAHVRGTMHWDILSLYRGALDGIRRAHDVHGSLDSVGVDSWAVDYGLLTDDGTLLGNPVHYRDRRTASVADSLTSDIGFDTFYSATGIAFQPFNTVFQLAAEARGPLFERATHAALIPDLITFWLTGVAGTELTNASTTALLDPRTLDWHRELAQSAGVELGLFAPLRCAGTVLGPLSSDVVESVGLTEGRRLVSTVPSHDTAAAVAGIPATTAQFGFIATGTWALVGLNLTAPVITAPAREANFTNELAADGSVRFLRNVTGFWLLQECQREWASRGVDWDSASLAAAAGDVPGLRAVLDVQHPSLADPGRMPQRISELASTSTGEAIDSPAEITRCIFDSIALAIRVAVRAAVALSGFDPEVLHLVGGGVHNRLFCQLVADATGRPVLAGPGEAAAWGNALYQAVALGVVDPADTRALLARSETVARYEPVGNDGAWAGAERRLQSVAATR